MDFVPWPNGIGFEDTEVWWDYVRSQPEKDRLNLLVAIALLSEEVCCLLLKHDRALLSRFALSEQTMSQLSEVHAKSLDEFAGRLLVRQVANS